MTDCGKGKAGTVKGKAGTVHPECIGEKHYSDDHGTGSAIKMSESPDVDLQKDEGGAMPDTTVQNALEKAKQYETYEEYDWNTDPEKKEFMNRVVRGTEQNQMRGQPRIKTPDPESNDESVPRTREEAVRMANGIARGKRMQTRQQDTHARRADDLVNMPTRTGAVARILAEKGYQFSAEKLDRLLNEVLNAREQGRSTTTMKPQLAQDIGDAYDSVKDRLAEEDETNAIAPINRPGAVEDPELAPYVYQARESERDLKAGANKKLERAKTKRFTAKQLDGKDKKSDNDETGEVSEASAGKVFGQLSEQSNSRVDPRVKEEENAKSEEMKLKGETVERQGQDFTPKIAGKDFELTQSPENVEEHRQNMEGVRGTSPDISNTPPDPMPDRDTKTQSHGKMPSMAELMKSAEQRTIDARGAPSGYKSYGHSFNGQSIPIQNGYRQVFITRNDPVMPPVSEMKVTKN